jgi:hypothetical protein
MLDRVQRRRFLVQPAGEYAAPALVGALHVDLDECAGQFLFLPRRARLTGAEADDEVLPPRRLARVERDALHDPVAFVEDAEDRDALGHRSDALLIGAAGLGLGGGRRRILLLGAAAARGQRKGDQQRSGELRHAWSGIHGS